MRIRQFDVIDLPVYRLTEDRYYAERNAYVDRIMYEHPLPSTPSSPSTAVGLSGPDATMRDHLVKSFGGPWNYNEIIGFLRLHFLGSQVRAEYWRVDVKRIVRSRTKIFVPWAHKLVPEKELPMSGTSEEIFRAVTGHVEDCKRSLRDRHVDATTLESLGPYIDWRALLHGP